MSQLESIGDQYEFKIEVFNEIGSAISLPSSFTLASVPNKPISAPIQDMQGTSASKIYAKWDLLSEEDNGGSTVLGYDLWRDDGHSGDFESLFFSDSIIASSFTDLS